MTRISALRVAAPRWLCLLLATCLAFALGVALTTSLSPPPLHAHPLHMTLAELEYNRDSGKLEVALRLPPLELEQALTIFGGIGRVSLDNADEILDPKLLSYLKHHFVVTPPRATDVAPAGTPEGAPSPQAPPRDKAIARESLPILWVGKEVTLTRTWLYFEMPLPKDAIAAGLHRLSIRNSVLSELQESPLNSIMLRQGEFSKLLRSTLESVSIDIPEALRGAQFTPTPLSTDARRAVAQELVRWRFADTTRQSTDVDVGNGSANGSADGPAAGSTDASTEQELTATRRALHLWSATSVVTLNNSPAQSSETQWLLAQRLTEQLAQSFRQRSGATDNPPTAAAPADQTTPSPAIRLGLLISPSSAEQLNRYVSGEALPTLFTQGELASWHNRVFVAWLEKLKAQQPVAIEFVGLEQHLPPHAGDATVQSTARQLYQLLRRHVPDPPAQTLEILHRLRRKQSLEEVLLAVVAQKKPHLIDHLDTLAAEISKRGVARKEQLLSSIAILKRALEAYQSGTNRVEHLADNIGWHLRRQSAPMIVWSEAHLNARGGRSSEERSLSELLTEQWGLQHLAVGLLALPRKRDASQPDHAWETLLASALPQPRTEPSASSSVSPAPVDSAPRFVILNQAQHHTWQLPHPLRLRRLTTQGRAMQSWRNVALTQAYDALFVFEHGDVLRRLP